MYLYAVDRNGCIIFHQTFQEGEHSSIQDAQAAMRLYTMFKKQWEADLGKNHTKKKAAAGSKAKSSSNNDKNGRKQYEDSDSE